MARIGRRAAMKAAGKNNIGPAIQRFVTNVKAVPGAFKVAGQAIKKGTLGQMVYNDMNPMGKRMVDMMKKSMTQKTITKGRRRK